VKHRVDAVRIFRSAHSIILLIGAMQAENRDEWHLQRFCMGVEAQPGGLPLAAFEGWHWQDRAGASPALGGPVLRRQGRA
jgi:hypothetical protein